MTKTVTSLFHTDQHAASAARHLEQAGIPKDEIDIWSTPHNLPPLLEDLGVSRADSYAYAEGVIRGGSVVIVKCGEADVARVVAILDQEGVLDLDEQRESWRSEGWLDSEAAAEEETLLHPASSEPRSDLGHGRVRVQPRSTDRPAKP
jgi:hypothetical protein